jgi:signal transduction histidine kinase
LPKVYADAVHLQETFMNIVVNALEAMNQLPRGEKRYIKIISGLELEDEFRVIHACWDQGVIDTLSTKGYLNNDNSLKAEFFPQAAQKGHELYEIIEILLKGKEISLPAGASFQDNDGNSY